MGHFSLGRKRKRKEAQKNVKKKVALKKPTTYSQGLENEHREGC